MNLKDIIEICQGTWVNSDSFATEFGKFNADRITSLEVAGPSDLAFFFSKDYQQELLRSKAGILVTAPAFVEPMKAAKLPLFASAAVVSCADPYLAMAKLSQAIAKKSGGREVAAEGVHAKAVVHPSARLAKNVSVGPYSVIGADVEIGEGTAIASNVSIERGCKIGDHAVIFPNVTLYANTQIGSRTRLHAGVVLGADGFGYAAERKDGKVLRHEKIIHTGRVVVGSGVEIGANTTVDRGTFTDTVIEDGVKIDNLVQVGHNCRVGKGTILCGNVGMAGNSSTGEFVTVGGGAGLSNKVHIGDRSSVGGMTGVGKDVAPDSTAMGLPARELREYFRLNAMLSKMLKDKEKERRE